MVKAVIYDMDGVLIDSEPLWKIAEIEVFRTVGIELTIEMCNLTMGYRTDEVVEYWYNRQPWDNKTQEQVKNEMIDKVAELIKEQGKPMKGLIESLDYFKSKGFKIAVASSSVLKLINAVVDHLNIRQYFEELVSAEQEEFGKPHPAVYISAAKKIGIPTVNCMAIEDSFHGCIAAKAAKMKVIAIPDPSYSDTRDFGFCDAKLANLSEVNTVKLD